MAKKDDLKELTQPQSNEVVLSNGTKIVIEQIKVKQLAAFGKCIKQIFPSGIGGFDKIEISDLVLTNASEIIELVKICSGVESDVIEDLDVDELILLAGKVAEVNIDFFMKRVLPGLAKASTDLEQTFTKLDGQTL